MFDCVCVSNLSHTVLELFAQLVGIRLYISLVFSPLRFELFPQEEHFVVMPRAESLRFCGVDSQVLSCPLQLLVWCVFIQIFPFVCFVCAPVGLWVGWASDPSGF